MTNLNKNIYCAAGLRKYLSVLIVLISFFLSALSNNVYAVPTKNQCKVAWTMTSITTGMKFGTFSIGNPGSGTISLTGGSTRGSTGTVDMSTGSVVQSHQIVINNTLDPDCGDYGLRLKWDGVASRPNNNPMTGPGTDIAISDPQVIVEGVAHSLRYDFIPAAVPFNIEIIATMTPSAGQSSGTYASANYTIQLRAGNAKHNHNGTSETVAITALTLTNGFAMNFGTIAAGSVATTVSVDAFGSVTAPAGSGNALVTIDSGSALTFTIQGESGIAYNLNIADGMLDDGGPGVPMPVTITGDDSTTLDGTPQTVTVTGDLLVGSNQSGGNYSSTVGSGVPIAITADYN